MIIRLADRGGRCEKGFPDILCLEILFLRKKDCTFIKREKP